MTATTETAPITTIGALKLTKRFGRNRALANVSVELAAGSVCALLGPNGAGKSTLIGILSTLMRPTAGNVVYRSEKQTIEAGRELRGQIGVLAHEAFVYSQLTAIENLRFFGKLYGVQDVEVRVPKLLSDVGLEEAAWNRPAAGFSRGMLQRLAVARALLPEPQVLLFDEPFTGLDHAGIETLSRALGNAKKEGRLVLVVSHDLEPLGGVANHVVILRRGQVAADERRDQPFSSKELRVLYAEHSAAN